MGDNENRATMAPEQQQHEQLSPRQTQVLGLIAEGLTNQAIADRLSITFSTARAHVAAVIRWLEVGNRTRALAGARERGLLVP